jgi:hypothetical protein
MANLLGWFMIATSIGVAVLFITIAMGDDNDNR